MFTKALALAPQAVAALAGLGRAALAKRDYARAVQNLERALAIDPESDSLHSPLAIAYRGLGQLDKAEPHLRQWRNRDILVPDPLKQELDLLLESSLSYELRGVRALEARDWLTAVSTFRKGLELSQENTMLRRSLQHKLGTALFADRGCPGGASAVRRGRAAVACRGRRRIGGQSQLQPCRADDGSRRTQRGDRTSFGGGQIPAELRRSAYCSRRRIVAHWEGPGGAGSLQGRARDQPARRSGVDGRSARTGPGATLSGSQDRLQEAMQLQPDHPEFAHALARLLAAAPDDRVRDGQRSMQLGSNSSSRKTRAPILGETMAMAFAELGISGSSSHPTRRHGCSAESGASGRRASHGSATSSSTNAGNLCRTPFPDDDPF